VSGEIERAVERKPSRNKPKALLKTDRCQGCKASKEGDFKNEIVAASGHYRKQNIERANDCQHGRIKGPVTVVANYICKRHDPRSESRTHAKRDCDCTLVHERDYHVRAKALQMSAFHPLRTLAA
jgi:hypothetical protein